MMDLRKTKYLSTDVGTFDPRHFARVMFLSFALSLLLTSCTTTFDEAWQAHQSNQLQKAYDLYVQCANQGEPVCYNNLGYMFEHNQVRSTNPRQEAIRHYKIAARYGHVIAQKNLRSLGVPIPHADLKWRDSSNGYVCSEAIYKNDSSAKAEARRRFNGGISNLTCLSLAREHQRDMEELRKSATEALVNVLK